jgi:osmotically-inducible protein OsmY
MERADQRITARYSNIPDHSDLRGFTYRAPLNYQWTDDHEGPGFSRHMEGDDASRSTSNRLWESVRSFSGRGPKGYRRPDERIREDVCESLMKHPGIDASEFEVTVKDGIVTLQGSVPDRWMKRASEWVVDGVSGVRDIRNELNIP